MPAKKRKPEEIVGKLRKVEIILGRAARLSRHASASQSADRRITAGAKNMAA